MSLISISAMEFSAVDPSLEPQMLYTPVLYYYVLNSHFPRAIKYYVPNSYCYNWHRSHLLSIAVSERTQHNFDMAMAGGTVMIRNGSVLFLGPGGSGKATPLPLCLMNNLLHNARVLLVHKHL